MKALADRFSQNTFNRENLLLEPYNTVDPEGFSLGLPEEERRDAVKFLFGSPWRYLINNGYIGLTKSDFYEITPEGHTEAVEEISAIKVDRTVAEGLRFLHPDLQGYEHYFREGKHKEAVTAAFMRVERRLQIKGRCLLKDCKPGQRLGSIDVKKDFDAVLMVLLDENFNATSIYEADREDVLKVLAEPGSKSRNERGALGVSKFKSIARLRWQRSTPQ